MSEWTNNKKTMIWANKHNKTLSAETFEVRHEGRVGGGERLLKGVSRQKNFGK